MRRFIINILFKLLGNSYTQQHNISYLFGSSTGNHPARMKRWEKALVRVWKDKDLLDFLFYQAESDKENVFKGKINTNLSKGARLRTLFIVYSARRAFEKSLKRSTATEQSEANKELQNLSNTYKGLTNLG